MSDQPDHLPPPSRFTVTGVEVRTFDASADERALVLTGEMSVPCSMEWANCIHDPEPVSVVALVSDETAQLIIEALSSTPEPAPSDEPETFIVREVDPSSGPFDSLILFTCVDGEGHAVTVAADHRPALDIIEALNRGEEPTICPESWAIVSRT